MLVVLCAVVVGAVRCSVKSGERDVDLADPRLYEENTHAAAPCPAPFMDLTVFVTSPVPATLRGLDAPLNTLRVFSTVPITVSSPLVVKHFTHGAAEIAIHSLHGSFTCLGCDVVLQHDSVLPFMSAHALTAAQAYLVDPVLQYLTVTQNVTVVATQQTSLESAITSGTLTFLSLHRAAFEVVGSQPQTIDTTAFVFSQIKGVLPSYRVVSLTGEPWQHTDSYVHEIETLHIPGGTHAIHSPHTFSELFVANANLQIDAPVRATVAHIANATVRFDSGKLVATFLVLENVSLVLVGQNDEYFFADHATVKALSLSVQFYVASCLRVVGSTTPITHETSLVADSRTLSLWFCLHETQLQGHRLCSVLGNSTTVDLMSAQFEQPYCPCPDCIYAVSSTAQTSVHVPWKRIGGIHCDGPCTVSADSSLHVGEVKGYSVTFVSGVVVERYVPSPSATLQLLAPAKLVDVIPTEHNVFVIAARHLHCSAHVLRRVNFFVKQSLELSGHKTLFQQGSVTLETGARLVVTTHLLFSGDLFTQHDNPPIHTVGNASCSFLDARAYLHTNTSRLNDGVFYLLISDGRVLTPDSTLPEFHLIDNATGAISQPERLFVECFGRFLVFKHAPGVLVDCSKRPVPQPDHSLLTSVFLLVAGLTLLGVLWVYLSTRPDVPTKPPHLPRGTPEEVIVYTEE